MPATKTKPKKARPPRPKRMKQQFIPGTEPESNPALDAAAETYHEAKIARCELSKEEDQAKDNLIDKMKEFGVDRYETPDGIIVTLTSLSNVKTKRKSRDEQASDSFSENGHE